MTKPLCLGIPKVNVVKNGQHSSALGLRRLSDHKKKKKNGENNATFIVGRVLS